MRSAWRRVLTNTSVVRCSLTSCARRSYSWIQTSPDITASSGAAGISSCRSRSRAWPESTMVQSAVPSALRFFVPTRKRATSSMGFCVAERPTRVSFLPASDSSRSRVSARCAPRLLPAMAWISSTITVRVVASICRPDSEPMRMYSDSGVVTTMCGGRLTLCRRSCCGVSPVRTKVRMPGSGSPSSRSSALIPASGASRLRLMSLESALRGDTYTTRVSSVRAPAATPSRTSSSITARKAARVLPEPVGAAIST